MRLARKRTWSFRSPAVGVKPETERLGWEGAPIALSTWRCSCTAYIGKHWLEPVGAGNCPAEGGSGKLNAKTVGVVDARHAVWPIAAIPKVSWVAPIGDKGSAP